jgi:hypothetical protein
MTIMRGPAAPALGPIDRLRLAGEILVTLVQVRRGLASGPLPRLVAALRCAESSARAPWWIVVDVRDGPRLGHVVTRTLDALPIDVLCLTRALVLLRVLARRGMNGAVVIAVTPGLAAEFAAHAWIECDGVPLLDRGDDSLGRLVTL